MSNKQRFVARPGLLLVALLVSSAAALMGTPRASASAFQDHFDDATLITGTNGVLTATLTGATSQLGEPFEGRKKSVWIRWLIPTAGILKIQCPRLPENFYYIGAFVGDRIDRLRVLDYYQVYFEPEVFYVPVTRGMVLNLGLFAFSEAEGSVVLEARYAAPNPVPPNTVGPWELGGDANPETFTLNDAFAHRPRLTGAAVSAIGYAYTATLADLDEPQPGYGFDASLWWSWEVPADGFARFNTTGTSMRHQLAVFRGREVSRLWCAAFTGVGFDAHEVRLPVHKGEHLSIAIYSSRGYGQDEQRFAQLNITHDAPFDHPVVAQTQPRADVAPESFRLNDAFAHAIELRGSTVLACASNHEATKTEFGEPFATDPEVGGSLWWTWIAPETGLYEIHGHRSQAAHRIAVFRGHRVDDLQLVARSNSRLTYNGGSDGFAALTFDAQAGATNAVAYHRLGPYSGGLGWITITPVPNTPNPSPTPDMTDPAPTLPNAGDRPIVSNPDGSGRPDTEFAGWQVSLTKPEPDQTVHLRPRRGLRVRGTVQTDLRPRAIAPIIWLQLSSRTDSDTSRAKRPGRVDRKGRIRFSSIGLGRNLEVEPNAAIWLRAAIVGSTSQIQRAISLEARD